MDRIGENVKELEKYSFLLGSAIRNEDSDQFLSIYDSIVPSTLSESEVECVKDKARRISELPDQEFNQLVLKARDFSLARRSYHDMNSDPYSSEYIDSHLEKILVQDDCEFFDMESSGILYDQASKATLTTYTLDDSEKRTDEDSGLFNCSKATNSVYSLSDEDDISDAESRGVYDYYPKTKPRIQIHSQGFVPNYDEAHDADSDTASHQDIDSPRSDSSGVREYELINSCPKNYDCFSETGTEMKTFRDFQNEEQQRKNTSCYDEEFEVDSDSDELKGRSIHQLLYRTVNHSSSDYFMDTEGVEDYDSEFESSLPSTDRRSQSSREEPILLSFPRSQNILKDRSIHYYPKPQKSVDEGVRFFTPDMYSRHKYGSVDNSETKHASKHSSVPPFGHDKHSLRRIGKSVDSLLPKRSHTAPIANMPEGETIDANKKKRKKKKTNKDEEKGISSQKFDVNGNPVECQTSNSGFREVYRQMRETSINESTQFNTSQSHYGSASHQAETIQSFCTSPIDDSQIDTSNVEKKKQQRSKKAKEKVILSEEIENYQGDKELDELLDFIENNKKTKKHAQINGLDSLKSEKNGRKPNKDSKKTPNNIKEDVNNKLDDLNEYTVNNKLDFDDEENFKPIHSLDSHHSNHVDIASKNLIYDTCIMGNSQNKDEKSNCDSDILKCGQKDEICGKVNGDKENSIKPLNDLYNRAKTKGKDILKRDDNKETSNKVVNEKDNNKRTSNKNKSKPSDSKTTEKPKTINNNKNMISDTKRVCESSSDTCVSLERTDFRFTDIDLLPPVEAEFIVVGKKKKRSPVNNMQLNHREFQKEHKDNFNKIPNFTRNNIKTYEKTQPRSITPPLCNVSETVPLPAQDLSPSAFPALSSANRDGRRNSAGDVPTDISARFCDDSDLESVKSFPATQSGSYNRAVSPRLSANTPISYAKIAASPKPNCALPSGSQIEYNGPSDFDTDPKVTKWKGKPTERRHSIGTRPEDSKDSDAVSMSSNLQKSGLVSPRWNELDEVVSLRGLHKSGSQELLLTSSVATDIVLNKNEYIVDNENDVSVNVCLGKPSSSSSIDNSIDNCDKCIQAHLAKNSELPTTTDIQLQQPEVKSVTTSSPPLSVNYNISKHKINSSTSNSIHKESTNSFGKLVSSRQNNRKVQKSVIFMDKRVSDEPQNIGITFGFEDISDLGETNSSFSTELTSSVSGVAQNADEVNIKPKIDIANTSAFEDSHNTFLDSEIIINKKFMNKILPKSVTRLNGISQTVVSHSKTDSKENIDNSNIIPASSIQGDELCQTFTYGDFIPQISSNFSTSINSVRNKPYLRYLETPGGGSGKFDVYEAVVLLKKEWDKIEDLQQKQPDAVQVFCI